MRSKPPQAAAVYARISSDPSGERLGVQRQEADCLAEAKRRGWSVAEVYVDDDRSAFDSRRPRPEYQRLLRDIGLGLRDGVMIWRLDRLHRQPRELEEFIVLCDKHKVALATVTGDVDLSTSQGRLLARAWGAFAAHESEVRGERLSRAYRDRACRSSLPAAGGRLYGYTLGSMKIIRREAAVIGEAVTRLLAGESLRTVCYDLNKRRILTTTNREWQPSTLRRLLLNQRLAGISTYHGDPVRQRAWRGILTRRQSERMRAILADRRRLNNSNWTRWYQLKGLVRCGRCGAEMRGSPNLGKHCYRCIREPGRPGCGRLTILADVVEGTVLERAHERLDSEALVQALERERLGNRQWMRAKATLDEVQRKLERLARDHARDRLTRAEWRATRAPLLERIEASETAMMFDRAEVVLIDYIGNSDHLRAAWDDLGIDRRRTVLTALIQEIVIWPAPGATGCLEKRLQIWWRGEPRPRARRGARRQGVAERRAAGAFDGCSVEGCTRAHLARGLCSMHLLRVKHHGEPGEAALRYHPRLRRCALHGRRLHKTRSYARTL